MAVGDSPSPFFEPPILARWLAPVVGSPLRADRNSKRLVLYGLMVEVMVRQIGHSKLDKARECERFRRWAEKLGMAEFNVAAFDDLVMLNGLKATVEELEVAFLNIQRGDTYSSMKLKTVP